MYQCLILIIFAVLGPCQSALLALEPIWTTNPHLRCENHQIIASLSALLQYNVVVTYPVAFAVAPRLSYGITEYSGTDLLNEEIFSLTKTAQSNVNFQLELRINAGTRLALFGIRYLTISSAYPYRINVFQSIPLNYARGPLANVTIQHNSVRYYRNQINYTQLVETYNPASTYKTFPVPSQHRVVLFLTALDYDGTFRRLFVSYYNKMEVTNRVLTLNKFEVQLAVGVENSVSVMEFNIIVYDQGQLDVTGDRRIIDGRVYFGNMGGYFRVAELLEDNFLMGLIEFSSSATQSVVVFSLSLGNFTEGYGVSMPRPLSPRVDGTVMQGLSFSYFYFQQYACTLNLTFNPAKQLCYNQSEVQFCMEYQRLAYCRVCNQSIGFCAVEGRCDVCEVRIHKLKGNQFYVQVFVTYWGSFAELLNQLQMLTDGVFILNVSMEPHKFTLFCEYYKQLYPQPLLLHFHNQTFHIPIASSYRPYLLYSSTELQTEKQLNIIVWGLRIACYILIFISMFKVSMVGLEVMGLFQLSFLLLPGQRYINYYYEVYSELDNFHGYNGDWWPKDSLGPGYQFISYDGNFIGNCNVMLGATLLVFLLGLLLYRLGCCKCVQSKQLRTVGLCMMKQLYLAFLLFTAYNMSYSAALFFKHPSALHSPSASPLIYYSNLSIVIVCIVVSLSTAVWMCVSGESPFYSFVSVYKQTYSCRMYACVTLVYRCGLGFYVGYLGEWAESSLVGLAFPLAMLLYCWTVLPYKGCFDNYYCTIVHGAELVILYVANYYQNIEYYTSLSEIGHDFLPFFVQLGWMLASLGAGMLVVLHKFYLSLAQLGQEVVYQEVDKEGSKTNVFLKMDTDSVKVDNEEIIYEDIEEVGRMQGQGYQDEEIKMSRQLSQKSGQSQKDGLSQNPERVQKDQLQSQIEYNENAQITALS